MNNSTAKLLVVASILIVGGAGCGSSKPIMPDKPTGASQKPPEQKMVVTDVTIPTDFPTDVPRYAGSRVISAYVEPKRALIGFSSEDDSTKVLAWYDAQFTAAGYTLAQQGSGGNLTTHQFTKGNVTMTVNIQAETSNNLPSSLINVTRQEAE